MYAFLVVIAFIVVVSLLGIWARHRSRSIDDYYEREYQDPPVHGWTVGGGPGTV